MFYSIIVSMRCGNSGNGRRSQRGHKVLRKQAKCRDRHEADEISPLDNQVVAIDDTTTLPETNSSLSSLIENRKGRMSREDILQALDALVRPSESVVSRSSPGTLAFGSSHRKYTKK
jgi:hypothetical protein